MPGTLVMIRCMRGGSWIWDRYAPFLERRGWRCLRPVLRCHDAGAPRTLAGLLVAGQPARDAHRPRRCPVLVVSASNDRLTPAPVAGKTAGLLGSKAALREFPGHGHWVVGESGWEEIVRFAADWLEKHVGG